jgi:3-hydroxyisobutyrate dehydrogenase-like beta-hydroxyacid dehydrogenase
VEYFMTRKILVIGLGRMGFALAATLLKNNYEVSVWNRTVSKAAPLVEAGASQVSSVAEGINVSEVIVVCVGNYDDTKLLLEDCGDLTGKTLMQLTTASAPETREMETWAIQNGALYLDGAIMGFPSEVGTETGFLLVAGSEAAWRACESIVMCLGGASRFLGENVAAPTVLDAALLISEMSTIMGMIQGAHIVEKEGLDVGEYVEIVAGLVAADDGGDLRRQGNAIVRNDFSDTEAALGTWSAGLSNLVGDLAKRGLNVEFAQAISGLLERALRAGYAEEEVAAVIKVMRDEMPPTS